MTTHKSSVLLSWTSRRSTTPPFSLSKLPTQQYIMDERFEVILVAADEITDASIACDSVGLTTNGFWYHDPEKIEQGLHDLRLDEPGTLTVAHNAMFDGGILEWRYGIKPWMYLCTMMGARPNLIQHTPRGRMSLGELAKTIDMEKGTEVVKARGKRRRHFSRAELLAYAGYCRGDVAICRELGYLILEQLPWDELRLIDITIKQFTRPQIKLDTDTLRLHLVELREEKANLLTTCGLSDAAELRSNEKFAELLRNHGVAPPMKESPATGDMTYAFAKSDAGFKEVVLDNPDSLVSALGAARVGHKSSLAESRAQRYLLLSELPALTGIPTLYYGAHTGRQSGYDKLNFQNNPRGSALRRAICAPEGFAIVSGDLSQIEARVLAVVAQCLPLIELFTSGQDPYELFAARVYHRNIEAVTPHQRRVCKSAILGLGFGMGPDAFSDYLRVMGVRGTPMREVKRLVYDTYRGSFPEVPKLWMAAGSTWISILMGATAPRRHGPLCIAPEFIGLPNGMTIHYTNIGPVPGDPSNIEYGPELNRSRIYSGKLVENVVQALARIIVMDAMLYIDRLSAGKLRAAFTVHDELLYVVPKRVAEQMAHVLHKALTRTVPWMPELPVEAEVKIGLNYGEMSKWKS